jgi:hypothetical protein
VISEPETGASSGFELPVTGRVSDSTLERPSERKITGPSPGPPRASNARAALLL